MRITFLLGGGFNMSGGHRVISIYADRLMKRGHEVLVASSRRRQLPLRVRLRALRKGEGWRRPASAPQSYFDNLAVPRKLIGEYGPESSSDLPDADVVIATWWETAEWVAKLPPEKGAKAFFVQGYEAFAGSPKDRVDATWRLPLHKIAASKWLGRLARDQFGDGDVTVAPNSVDYDQFHAPPRGKQPIPTVGFLYHPAPLKGGATALAAVREVSRQLPVLRLRTFGEIPFQEPLPPEIEHEHWRHPPQESIRTIYAQCDVWLTASISEGFSLPSLEAMACRCPVVATRSGGPEDLIKEGENGFLAPVGDAAALSEHLLTVLHAPDNEWRAFSDAACATASGYSWDDATDLFEAGLHRAIKRSQALRNGDQSDLRHSHDHR